MVSSCGSSPGAFPDTGTPGASRGLPPDHRRKERRLAHERAATPSFLALKSRPLLRTFVFGSLWGDSTDLRAGGSLRSALWRLRSTTHPLITLTSDHIELFRGVSVDLREGEALAHRVLDPSQALDDITEVNEDVLSSDLLPDWTEDWVLVEREAYHQLRLRALEALCRQLTANGRFGQAVQAGIAAVAGEPLRESARRALIEAHIAEGNISGGAPRARRLRPAAP